MWEPGPLYKNSTPLLVAGISALAMAVFEYLIVKKKIGVAGKFQYCSQ